MKVALRGITQPLVPHEHSPNEIIPMTPEDFLVYVARVSNPNNQLNLDTGPKLLGYCLRCAHVSVFETVSMTVEVETSVAIATQILRHKSFNFQQFSQRYADVSKLGDLLETPEFRKAGSSNRQGSIAELVEPSLQISGNMALLHCVTTYKELLAGGAAPESARFVLPECTHTRLYMTGCVRSWIFYFLNRSNSHAQKEHVQVSRLVYKDIFRERFPIIAGLLEDPVFIDQMMRELENRYLSSFGGFNSEE